MRYALLGALLVVGGVVAQIVAARNHPSDSSGAYVPGLGRTGFGAGTRYGWSPTAYDLVRIGGWALLIFGVVIVAFALMREVRR
jgi:hypothetical protein